MQGWGRPELPTHSRLGVGEAERKKTPGTPSAHPCPSPSPPATAQPEQAGRSWARRGSAERGRAGGGARSGRQRRGKEKRPGLPRTLSPSRPGARSAGRALLHPQPGSAQGRGQAGTKGDIRARAGSHMHAGGGGDRGEGRPQGPSGRGAPLVSGAGLTFAVLIYPAKHPKHAAGQVAPSGSAP